MHVVYRALFRIRVLHGFYAGGELHGDFALIPTAATRALLESRSLSFRSESDGVVVFGEVLLGSNPPELVRPVGADALRFVFELRALNPELVVAAELPSFRPSRSVFCFENLRSDVDAGRKYLSDAVAGARIGPAVALVTRGAFSYAFAAPTVQATLTVRNRFGGVLGVVPVRSPDGVTPLSEFRLELGALPGVVPGRYAVADDRGGSAELYYDPDLDASRPLGVVEIYSRTEALTPDGTNRVPASFRFLDGDRLTGAGDYAVRLESLATTWRYVVAKKYQNNGIPVNDLSIAGPLVFDRTVEPERAVFTSRSAVRFSDQPRGLRLMRGARELRSLPDPRPGDALGKSPTPGHFVSNVFINV